MSALKAADFGISVDNAVDIAKESADIILLKKIEELINLKIVINEANREIQGRIFLLSESKSLIKFWNEIPVTEGKKTEGYGNVIVLNYNVQIDEQKRNQIVETFQKKVDALQEEIDTYNYTTEVQWDEKPIEQKAK